MEPRTELQDSVIELLTYDYDADKDAAADAVDRAWEEGVYQEEADRENLAELIHSESRYWVDSKGEDVVA